MRIKSDRPLPTWLPAAGATASLALAAAAEATSSSRGFGALVLAGYVLAGIAFATSARQPADDIRPPEVEATPHAVRSRRTVVAAAALATSLTLGLAAYRLIFDSLRSGRSSIAGPVLWSLSLLVLLAAALGPRPLPTWPDAWRARPLAGSLRGRRALAAALVLVWAGGCVARLVDLARVPWGINADEGDRVASAMSLLSGGTTRNLFASGWFYISNVYFWLLAGVIKVLGIGFAEARVLGAVCSALTLGVIVWIAFRHFGARVALLTAVLGATLAVSLQFARETTEATPTALLWALSVAFLLEAGRRGGTWPWVAAGITGGLSVYFYPSGRLWIVLGALACLHQILRAPRERKLTTIAGTVVMGTAALLTVGPFFANARAFPGQLLLRANQTSVFSDDNAARLPYYNPHWSTLELLWAQLKHSLAIFANTGDGGGFWPTNRPILGAVLTVLVAVGLGWFTLSWRHTPRFTLALWFWVGIAGMVVTVETPDLQRMATAVPVLPLLAAGVIDTTATRVVDWSRIVAPATARAAGMVVGTGAILLVVILAVQQGRFYFGTYAQMYRWPQPTIQGEAVAAQGPNALVMTVGRESQQINSGWVRLLAPHSDRGAVDSPGTVLPLPLPADHDLAFMLYPNQAAYLPFLRDLYPGGALRDYSYVTEGVVVSVYRIPRARAAAMQGSLATLPSGEQVRVPTLGAPPPKTRLPAPVRWSAELHVPEYWDYQLRLEHGPATLRVDGKTVLALGPGQRGASVTVALARGRHLVTLDGVARSRGGPSVEWRIPAASAPFGPSGFAAWRPVRTSELVASTSAHGLLATVAGASVPPEQRLDGAVATCCLSSEVAAAGNPYVVRWAGTLRAPTSGRYLMSLFTQGIATLELDGRTVIRTNSAQDADASVHLRLLAGPHSVRLRYRVEGTGGGIEWTWKPPGAPESVIPPSALEPPAGLGVTRPVPLKTLAGRFGQPADVPLVVVR